MIVIIVCFYCCSIVAECGGAARVRGDVQRDPLEGVLSAVRVSESGQSDRLERPPDT